MMKSKQSEKIQVEWLIEQILELDKMQAMHDAAKNGFMSDQYKARRLGYFKELISLLATSQFNQADGETFPLILELIKDSYGAKPPEKNVVSQKKDPFSKTLAFYSAKVADNLKKERLGSAGTESFLVKEDRADYKSSGTGNKAKKLIKP